MTQEFLAYDKAYLKHMECFIGSIYDGTWIAEQGQGGSIHFRTTERTIVFLPHNLSLYRWRDATPNKDPLDIREILLLEALENKEILNEIVSLLVERMDLDFMRKAALQIISYLDRDEASNILKYMIPSLAAREGKNLTLAAIIQNSDPIDQEDD